MGFSGGCNVLPVDKPVRKKVELLCTPRDSLNRPFFNNYGDFKKFSISGVGRVKNLGIRHVLRGQLFLSVIPIGIPQLLSRLLALSKVNTTRRPPQPLILSFQCTYLLQCPRDMTISPARSLWTALTLRRVSSKSEQSMST